MTRRVNADEQPESEFVAKMRDVFRRRDAARTNRDKAALKGEMEQLMRTYLGRSAWDAHRAAEAVERVAAVPRDTSPDPSGHAVAQPSAVRDGKLAAAGRESE